MARERLNNPQSVIKVKDCSQKIEQPSLFDCVIKQ